jgi:hypothetical protein
MAEEEQAGEVLRALLRDLEELAEYLHGRGQNAYTLAQRFLENARREQDQQTKAFDEQQARMLDYQRYIWHEIAGLVEKLVSTYQEGGNEAANERANAKAQEQLGKQETAG